MRYTFICALCCWISMTYGQTWQTEGDASAVVLADEQFSAGSTTGVVIFQKINAPYAQKILAQWAWQKTNGAWAGKNILLFFISTEKPTLNNFSNSSITTNQKNKHLLYFADGSQTGSNAPESYMVLNGQKASAKTEKNNINTDYSIAFEKNHHKFCLTQSLGNALANPICAEMPCGKDPFEKETAFYIGFYIATTAKHTFSVSNFAFQSLDNNTENPCNIVEPPIEPPIDPIIPPKPEPKPIPFGALRIAEFSASSSTALLPEYVEIYNASGDSINLKGLQISRAASLGGSEKSIILQEDTFLPPNSELVLSADAQILHQDFFVPLDKIVSIPQKIGITSSSTNYMYLRNNKSEEIDAIYGLTGSADGSQNLINFAVKGFETDNYQNSKAISPGARNPMSVDTPDEKALRLNDVFWKDSKTLVLQFNRNVNRHKICPKSISLQYQDQISTWGQNAKEAHHELSFIFANAVDTGTLFYFNTEAIFASNGKTFQLENFAYARGANTKQGEILLTEIMFAPQGDAPKWLEIYNQSPQVRSLQNLKIGYKYSGAIKGTEIKNNYSILPHQYLVLTPDKEKFLQFYPQAIPRQVIPFALSSYYSSTSGLVALLGADFDEKNPENGVWEILQYEDKMHHPWLKNRKGVSLERVRLDLPAEQTQNWTSASAKANYATPTEQNSQHQSEKALNFGSWELENPLFSPDDDGYKDLLFLHYKLEDSQSMADILIYDSKGLLVQKLAENVLLGNSGTFIWDGKNLQGYKVSAGMYIIQVLLRNPQKGTHSFKKVCTVAVKRT